MFPFLFNPSPCDLTVQLDADDESVKLDVHRVQARLDDSVISGRFSASALPRPSVGWR